MTIFKTILSTALAGLAVAGCSVNVDNQDDATADEQSWGSEAKWGSKNRKVSRDDAITDVQDSDNRDSLPDDQQDGDRSDSSSDNRVDRLEPRKSDPALPLYAGKDIFDEIDGFTILNHPVYRAGVQRVVDDAADLKWLLDDHVTAGPIEYRRNKLLIWACEPHNCGNRNWTVMIDVKSDKTEVCFRHDSDGGPRHNRYTEDGPMVLGDQEECLPK